MKTTQRIDVHGLSIRGDGHRKNHDHFAIASLSKSMRLHQSNLTLDDESLVHGHSQGHLFLVADGISDGPAPDRASGAAVDSVVSYFLNEMPWYHLADGSPEDVTLALEDALHNAQDELLESFASKDRRKPGTTLTLAFVFWPNLYIAHVGDSRCYLNRSGTLRQLTTDHCQDDRTAAEAKAAAHVEHRLWNALGGKRAILKPEVRHVRLLPGDRLALVTDGVTQANPKAELRTILERCDSAEDACDRLMDGSGQDDRTAIVARFLPPEGIESLAEEAVPSPHLAVRRSVPKPERNRKVRATRTCADRNRRGPNWRIAQ